MLFLVAIGARRSPEFLPMHELSLTSHLVAMVEERAEGHPVTRVRLRIGRLAGVAVNAVRFCFDVCAQGTPVEGAALVVEEPEGRAECTECKKSIDLPHLVAICPCERAAPLRIVSGEELMIVDFEMETD